MANQDLPFKVYDLETYRLSKSSSGAILVYWLIKAYLKRKKIEFYFFEGS